MGTTPREPETGRSITKEWMERIRVEWEQELRARLAAEVEAKWPMSIRDDGRILVERDAVLRLLRGGAA